MFSTGAKVNSFSSKIWRSKVGVDRKTIARCFNGSLVLQKDPFSHHVSGLHMRCYSQTAIFCRKRTKEDELIEQLYKEQPKIQSMNAEGIPEEEVHRILEIVQDKIKKDREERFVPNWKPGMRKRPLLFSNNLEDLLEGEDPSKPPRWTHLDRRCGMLAIKVGMMPFFDEWGVRHPCTILFADQNVVLGHKTEDKHGYIAVQVAAGQRKRKNVSRTIMGQYKELMHATEYEDDNPPYLIREFRISDEKWLIPIHTQLHARHFVPGQNIDIAGISKGKGFQGPMKRHGFSGMPASHGVSKSHRAHGSVGQCQNPGKVWRGKKMAGNMGAERVTVQNARIVKIDRGRNLIFVRGSVPGPRGRFVEIRDAIKRPLWKTDKVVANEDGSIPDRPPLPTYDFEEEIDGSGEPGYEEIMPADKKDPFAPEAMMAA